MDESTFTNSNKSFVSSRMKNPEAENSLAQSENEKTRWLRHYGTTRCSYNTPTFLQPFHNDVGEERIAALPKMVVFERQYLQLPFAFYNAFICRSLSSFETIGSSCPIFLLSFSIFLINLLLIARK
mmetsp:Transcript_19094/g.44223  ORF Transcript_19094/g.44223 Transcript_19094/m.44223 type:complete len:126 (-) Transcript_19094:347-724(-)